MSWKNIKTFLIILFLLINIYLIFSHYGFEFKQHGKTYIDKETLDDTISIIQNNYNIYLNKNLVPLKTDNLGIIDASNIIYTPDFKDSGYDFKTSGASFETNIPTDIISYNEENAGALVHKFLADMNIDTENCEIIMKKGDSGITCTINELLGPYSIFNGKIKMVFTAKNMNVKGSWYTANKNSLNDSEKPAKMSDITGVIVDMASSIANSDGTQVKIIDIDYGYYVSYYDENSVIKSSSAIPCYLLKDDKGCKYYYDALNGKQLKYDVSDDKQQKQEE